MNDLIVTLEDEITLFKQKLEDLLNTEPLNSCKVLELSEELDVLLAKYYSLKNGSNH